MKKRHNSFPKIKFFFICLSLLVYSCEKSNDDIIEKKDFINVYSKILIINEMNLENHYRSFLMDKLYEQYDINGLKINKTIEYFNQIPEEWIDIADKVRKQIKNMKKDSIFIVGLKDSIKISN